MSIPEAPRRQLAGWIILVTLFLLISGSALAASLKRKPDLKSRYASQEMSLRLLVSQRELTRQFLSSKDRKKIDEQRQEALSPIIAEFAPDVTKNTYTARLYLAYRTEQGKKIMPEAVEMLAKSADPTDQALAKIYGATKLTPDQAKALAKQLPDQPFSLQLAKIHAEERAGLSSARDGISYLPYVKTMAAFMVGFLIVVSGGIVWLVFISGRRHGNFIPKGIPLDEITVEQADRVAIRAAQIFGGFLGLSWVIARLRLGNSAEVVLALSIVGLVWVLSRIKAGGELFSLSRLGLRKEHFWRHVGIGILGFLAEIPVTILFALFGYGLFGGLATPSHPASETLQQTRELGVILPLMFFGAIVAPFWEEIMFRGLLFPAIKRVSGSLTVGVVASSLIFGLIHPQGPALTLALASVGGMSCLLSYQTRSLVPSIVMHMLHNTVTFALVLLVT